MIAAGDNINSGGEKLSGSGWSYPGAASRILTIRNNHIDPIPGPQLWDQNGHRTPSWFSHDVADKQNLHRFRLGGSLGGASCNSNIKSQNGAIPEKRAVFRK
jgi:hypothetical protein